MNKHDFLSELITLSVVVYTIRHITYRIISSIKPLDTFYKNRMILPSVRVWDNKILYAIYNHIFALVETVMFTLIFLSLYIFVGDNRYSVMVFIIYIIITAYKEIYFTYMLSVYPKTMLLVDILKNIVLNIVCFIALYFLLQYFH